MDRYEMTEAGDAAVRPVMDVGSVDEAGVGAARKPTAAVASLQRKSNGGWRPLAFARVVVEVTSRSLAILSNLAADTVNNPVFLLPAQALQHSSDTPTRIES